MTFYQTTCGCKPISYSARPSDKWTHWPYEPPLWHWPWRQPSNHFTGHSSWCIFNLGFWHRNGTRLVKTQMPSQTWSENVASVSASSDLQPWAKEKHTQHFSNTPQYFSNTIQYFSNTTQYSSNTTQYFSTSAIPHSTSAIPHNISATQTKLFLSCNKEVKRHRSQSHVSQTTEVLNRPQHIPQ